MKLKTLVLTAAFLIASFFTKAQSIFEKYSDNKEVTYLSVKPKMFQLLAKLDIEANDKEAQEYIKMVESITTFKTLVTYDDAITSDISKWVNTKENVLEELMEVNDDGANMKFYTKEGKTADVVNELLIFVNGLDNKLKASDLPEGIKERQFKTVLVYLEGNIDLNQISKLINKLDIAEKSK